MRNILVQQQSNLAKPRDQQSFDRQVFMDGVVDGQLVVGFLVWLGCFVGKKFMTMGEPSED